MLETIRHHCSTVFAVGAFSLSGVAHGQNAETAFADAKRLVSSGHLQAGLERLLAAGEPADQAFEVSLYLRSAGLEFASTTDDAWSEPFLQAAWHAAPVDQSVYRAVLLNDLAGLALRHKRVAAARERVAAAWSAAEALQGEADGCDVRQLTLNNRALLALEIRDYAAGMGDIQALRDLHCTQADPRRLVDAALTAGAIYRQQGDFARGEAEYRSALRMIEESREFSPDVRDSLLAEAHRVLGELCIYDGYRLSEARREIDRARRLSSARNRELQTLLADAHLVEIDHFEQVQGRQQSTVENALASIAERYGLLRERFAEIGSVDGAARMTYHRARALSGARQYAEAAQAFTEAADAYGVLQDPEWVWRSLLGRATQELGMGRAGQGRASLDRAITVFESIGDAVAGGEQSRDLFGESYRRLYERAIDAELAAATPDWSRIADLTERSRSREVRQNMLWTEDNSVCAEELVSAARSRRQTGIPVSQEGGETLPPAVSVAHMPSTATDVVHVQFAIGENGVAVRASRVGMTPLQLQCDPTAPGPTCISRAALTSAVTGLAVTLRATAGDEAAARSDTNLGALYDVLIRPLEAVLKPTDTVIFSPVGVLELVPFAALIRTDPTGSRYLVERVASVAILGADPSPAVRPSAWPWRVSAIVNPQTANIELRRPEGDAALQSAETLANDTILSLFPDSMVVSGDRAVKQSVWDGLESYDAVHIGAHAQISEAPYLTLAPGGVQGRLTPCEILSHPQRAVRARLVVLAACQSAAPASDFRKDTRLASLSAAFASIGVPNVIGTLWEVAADATSEELMTTFYEELARSRGAAALSLAEAQRELAGSRSPYSHPYYWAGFVITTAVAEAR